MSLVTREELANRQKTLAAAEILQAVAARLNWGLQPLRARPLFIPDEKALLSQDGGVCEQDGARLRFDPMNAEDHVCPTCGATYRGDRHYRAWIWRYHLWLSERAIHFALLDALGVAPNDAEASREIISGYVDRYRHYPNRDNVLGPTRPFFSTYLESIWLTQLIVAAEILDALDRPWPASERRAFEALVSESVELIASFNEGWSNRQVWNNGAIVAAASFLRNDALKDRALLSSTGLFAQLDRAVSTGGRWHEGENYHFFALRGLALAAEFARDLDVDFYDASWSRLAKVYTAPLETVLPDCTLPARGDSPYGVSLMQPRFVDLWELGWARTSADSLESLLSDLYARSEGYKGSVPLNELCEVEENRPAQPVSREAVSWKGLLWMNTHAPARDPDGWKSDSVLVDGTGPVVLRPGPDRYISLECTGTGSGHAHPDVLHLTLFDGQPWLQDFGTGSYVDRSLHWFRSTLSHNAPGEVGVGQRGARAWCAAFDQLEGWAWVRAVAEGLVGSDSRFARSIIAGPDYLVDVVDVIAEPGLAVDLPIHPLGDWAEEAGEAEGAGEAEEAEEAGEAARRDAALPRPAVGGAGHEHGYDAVSVLQVCEQLPRIEVTKDPASFTIHFAPRDGEQMLLAEGLGPPTLALGHGERLKFVVRRAKGAGRWVQLYCRDAAVRDVVVADGEIRVIRESGSEDRLSVHDDHVRIDRHSGSPLRLAGVRSEPPRPQTQDVTRVQASCAMLDRMPTLADVFSQVPPRAIRHLAEPHYRRSEASYPGPEAFSADVAYCAFGSEIFLAVDVTKREVVIREASAVDPRMDNEEPDVHSDGVQCYFGFGTEWKGYLVVPEAGDKIRVKPVRGTGAKAGELTGTWGRTPHGYRMLLRCDINQPVPPGSKFLVNVIVNEMHRERERRAGQLALTGGGWVYLRGDRESPHGAAVAEVQ